MVLPRGRQIGGAQRPPVGPWIQDKLSGGRVTYAQELYREYKDEIGGIPLKVRERVMPGRPRKGGKRRVMSWRSFTIYLYALRVGGLIEYTGHTAPAHFKDGSLAPALTPRHYFRAVPANIGDSAAWANVWETYRARK